MIFGPDLIPKVLDGSKTVTRRRSHHRDDRPLRYLAGGVYAVQPGRGKPHVGHIEVLSVSVEELGLITQFHYASQRRAEAQEEGFKSLPEFVRYWIKLHGGFNPHELVARIAFRRAPDCPKCAVLPSGSCTSSTPTCSRASRRQTMRAAAGASSGRARES